MYKLRELKDKIRENYWKNGQYLYLETMEDVSDGDYTNVTIFLKGTNIYLFEVQNFSSFTEPEIVRENMFRDPPFRIITKFDGVKVSSTPLYINRMFTLPTFNPLTEQDILNCAKYFLSKVLGCYLIFNIGINKEKI